MQIIALCGQKGSGKSTLAEQIEKKHNYTRLLFSEPIKLMVMSILLHQGVEAQEARLWVYDAKLKEMPCPYLGGKTTRYAQKTIGTEWGRDLMGEDFWVEILAGALNYYKDEDKSIVIDDLRFPNEFRMLKEFGANIIRITRSGLGPLDDHPSETLQLDFKVDFELDNPIPAGSDFSQTDSNKKYLYHDFLGSYFLFTRKIFS